MKKRIMVGLILLLAVSGAVEWRLMGRGARAEEQEADANRREPPVDRELLQRMADNAAKTFESTRASYDVGTEVLANVYVWSRRWLESERALAMTDAEELTVLRAHRERMKQLMLKVRALFVTGTKGGEQEKFFATKYYLAEADVWLASAKNRGAGKPTPLEKVPVSFRGPKGMTVQWEEDNVGEVISEPLVCPGTHEFAEGIHFLKVSGFGNLSGTLDVVSTSAKEIPIEISPADVKRIALESTPMTKVVYRTADGRIENATSLGEEASIEEATRHGEVLAILSLVRILEVKR